MYRNNAFSSAGLAEIADPPPDLSEARSDSSSTMRRLRSVVGELLVALTNTLNDERDSAQKSLSRAAVLLQTAEQSRAPATAAKGGLAPWQIRRVASHVETNLDKPIRSSDLATVVRLNPCYFSRVFRRSFGESPLRYVTGRRIERAQRLMLSTDSPLSEIALDCGFADQAHFSRLFRRMVGDTPRSWRRARVDPHAADPAPIVGARARPDRLRSAQDRAFVRANGMLYGAVRAASELAGSRVFP
jgi:AraC-like DNA-binding protein